MTMLIFIYQSKQKDNKGQQEKQKKDNKKREH